MDFAQPVFANGDLFLANVGKGLKVWKPETHRAGMPGAPGPGAGQVPEHDAGHVDRTQRRTPAGLRLPGSLDRAERAMRRDALMSAAGGRGRSIRAAAIRLPGRLVHPRDCPNALSNDGKTSTEKL